MRILVVGAGGVGAAFAPIAARRDFYEHIVFADYDEARATSVVDRYDAGTGRFSAAQVDASDASAVAELCRAQGITHVLNAVDPRFVMPIFDGAFEAGVTYLDMAMSLSHPHPDKPYELPGEKLGDAQFAKAGDWEAKGQLALVGIGVEPGLSDVFARYAQDHLFSRIDEAGVRDGANLVVQRLRLRAGLLDLDHDRGVPEPAGGVGEGPRLVHAAAVLRAGGLHVPGRDRAGRVRARRARRGAVDPAVGRLPARDVQVRARRRVHRGAQDAAQARAGQDRAGDGARPAGEPARRGGRVPARPGDARPADVAARPAPARGSRAPAPTATPREVYLYHVVDNEETWGRDGAQAVVWQTAINPVVALELLANGAWSGAGVLGPEAFAPDPFLDLLTEYGSPWGMEERTPA